jgi:hypothetical protein
MSTFVEHHYFDGCECYQIMGYILIGQLVTLKVWCFHFEICELILCEILLCWHFHIFLTVVSVATFQTFLMNRDVS